MTISQQQEVKERRPQTYDAEQIKEKRLETFKTELELTEQQETEVKALLHERHKEMEKNWEQRDADKTKWQKRVEKEQAAQERQKVHDAKNEKHSHLGAIGKI